MPNASVTQLLQRHPLYFQLHYLSCLVADADETPLLSHPPDPLYLENLKSLGFDVPSYALLSDFPYLPPSLSSWGPSESLQKWALERNISYKIPSLDLVRKIQSKEFCFSHFPRFEKSKLISSLDELTFWWSSFKGPKVLKTLYGSSGKGHHISQGDDLSKALAFFKRSEHSSPILIAQPWVERVLDFSTQWHIEKNGTFSYLGATVCENSSRGSYLKSKVGREDLLFKDQIDFFAEHLVYAKQAVEKLISLSFFGNVGFDAFIYKHPETNQETLFPIVEINARKTMGWVALKIAKKLCIDETLSINYTSNAENLAGLLPSHKDAKPFAKQLVLQRDPVCI